MPAGCPPPSARRAGRCLPARPPTVSPSSANHLRCWRFRQPPAAGGRIPRSGPGPRRSPVAVAGGERVVERVGPVLQLEVRAVGRGASRLRSIHTPDGQPVHDRISDVCSVPSVSTAKLGTPRLSTATVRASNGSSPPAPAGRPDLGVGEVVDDRRDRVVAGPSPPATTSTGSARAPRRSAPGSQIVASGAAAGTHTRADAVCVQLPLQLVGVGRIGVGQHRCGEGVLVGTAERDPGIGQVGVDVEVAVAGPVGAAAGGGDAGADQRHHQIARQRRRLGLRRRRPPRPPTSRPTPRRRPGPAPPTTARTSRRPGCPASTGCFAVSTASAEPRSCSSAEPAADHRVADLADRHRAGHRARPAQPQQLVRAGELVDRGAAVHPRHAVPQCQCLGVAQHRADSAPDDQPLARAGCGSTAPTRQASLDDTTTGPLGSRCHGPSPASGCAGYSSYTASSLPTRPSAISSRPPIGQRRHRASACRVDRQPIVLVGDPLPPSGSQPVVRRPGGQPVRAPAQRRHVAGQPADRPAAVLDERGHLVAVGVESPAPVAERLVESRRHHVGPVVRQRVPHHHRSRRPRWTAAASALSRAARPSSHASRQPVSRSRYTWSDSEPVMASWWAP